MPIGVQFQLIKLSRHSFTKEHRNEAEGEISIALVFFSGDMLTCTLRLKRYNFFSLFYF